MLDFSSKDSERPLKFTIDFCIVTVVSAYIQAMTLLTPCLRSQRLRGRKQQFCQSAFACSYGAHAGIEFLDRKRVYKSYGNVPLNTFLKVCNRKQLGTILLAGIEHHGWHNTDSAWYGPAPRVLALAKLTLHLARFIRAHIFGPGHS